MDAQAHLLSLGWAGPGHALDARPYKHKGHRGLAYDPNQVSKGNGLVKPLLVSQRQGRHGIGKRAHEPQAGNEWWLKGFESALGNIGKSESERSSGTATPETGEHTGKHGGLYGFFVKGQDMAGTIGSAEGTKLKKRKSAALDELDDGVQASNTRPVNEIKATTATDFEQIGAFIAIRDRDDKRRQRLAKGNGLEEFQQVSEFFEARSDQPKKHQETRRSEMAPLTDAEDRDQSGTHIETKEERRERRRRRREEKEAKRAAEGQKDTSLSAQGAEADEAAARVARRAERRRRKAEAAERARKASISD